MAPQGNFLTFLGSKELENASLNIVDEIFWDTSIFYNFPEINLQFRDFLR